MAEEFDKQPYPEYAYPMNLAERPVKREAPQRDDEDKEPSVQEEAEQLRLVSEELLTEVLLRKRTQEESEQSRSFLQAVIDANPEVMIVVDRDYRIVLANRAACKLAGGQNPALACMACHKLSHHRDLPCEGLEEPCPLQRVIETRGPVTTTHVHYNAEGERRFVEISAAPIFDSSGEVVQVVEACRDVTDRMRMEEELQKSEAELRAVLDATPFPVAIVDLQDDRIDFWSRSALALFGHTAPTASEWYQIAYPDSQYRREVIERWKGMLEKAQSSAQPVNTGEYRVTCRDGSVRVCELYASFLSDNLIVTFNDITDRKRAEEALHESEKRYRIVADFARDWEFWVGPDGLFRYTSPSCETITERKSEVGDSAEEFFRLIVHPEDLNRRLEHLREELAGKGPGEMKFRVVRPDGEIRWIHHVCQPVHDAQGRFLGVRSSNRDITEEKRED